MAMIASMSDERRPESEEAKPSDSPKPSRSAVDDLTAGLGLVLSAARKVVQGVEPKKVEELGRKAFSRIDRQSVEALGKKAKERLDPRHIEELAEDAGRELVRVVERVAERVESLIAASGEPPKAQEPVKNGESADPAARGDSAGSGETRPEGEGDGVTTDRPKVRIKSD